MAQRETLPDGSILLRHERTSLAIARLRPGVVLVKISGYDTGEHGNMPFDEVSAEIGRFGPLDLFVDIGGAAGASTDVRESWTRWFQANRPGLRKVSILVQSTFVKSAVEVSKLFSRTGDLIWIYSDPALFKDAILKAAPGFVESAAFRIGGPEEPPALRGAGS
jgi:hypothetical protein